MSKENKLLKTGAEVNPQGRSQGNRVAEASGASSQLPAYGVRRRAKKKRRGIGPISKELSRERVAMDGRGRLGYELQVTQQPRAGKKAFLLLYHLIRNANPLSKPCEGRKKKPVLPWGGRGSRRHGVTWKGARKYSFFIGYEELGDDSKARPATERGEGSDSCKLSPLTAP